MAEISDERLAELMNANGVHFAAPSEAKNMARELQRRRAEARQAPAGKLDGNEIWEWLFGALKGDVPDELTEDVLSELALHINVVFAARPAAHPDELAVDAFAVAMKAKLKWEREERHRGGWQNMSADELSKLLYEHLSKGDPIDVANLAMMLHQNGQRITTPEPQPAGVVTDAAQFLIDRLDDFEKGGLADDIEDACREFDGHVAPAIARLRSVLEAAFAARPTALIKTRNETAGFTEWVAKDRPTVTEDHGAYAILRDLDTRQVIGFRVYDSPAAVRYIAVDYTGCVYEGEDREQIIAIAQQSTRPAAEPVGVKRLKWGETSYGTPEAISVAGIYRITNAWDGGFNVNRGKVSFRGSDGRTNFATIDAAKAAAQADYEQRIQSALVQS